MPLTVLTDHDVNRILHSFTKKDIEELQENLADALHWYSTSSDANDCCSDYQPERTHLKRKDGSTTLFMPASGLTGQGVKVSPDVIFHISSMVTEKQVVNIVQPDTAGLPTASESQSMSSGDSRSSISSQSRQDSFSTVNTTGSGQTSSSAPTSVSDAGDSLSKMKLSPGSASTIRGSLTLLDNLGNTTGMGIDVLINM